MPRQANTSSYVVNKLENALGAIIDSINTPRTAPS
jgi:hypothetical protein